MEFFALIVAGFSTFPLVRIGSSCVSKALIL